MTARMKNVTSYQLLIQKATGAPVSDLALIERIMREEIFHSTLDWQTRAQFIAGAQKARRRLDEDRAFFEEDRAMRAALFEQMQKTHQNTRSP